MREKRNWQVIFVMKWWILRNKIFGLRKESRLKMATIVLFILAYGVGGFWALLEGFNYVSETLGIGYILIDRLFYVLFMVLFFMLITSQIIITYSSFYRSSEVEFLFSLPVSYNSVYVTRFLEATFLSSWAFMFLTVPMFMAYGVSRSLGASFYLVGVGLSLLFIFITAGIGTGLGVILVRYFPRKLPRTIAVIGIAAAVGIFLYYKKARQEFNWQTGDLGLVIDQMLVHTKISLFPLLPSYWISKGIFSAISEDWHGLVFYFLVLLSSSMFFVWLCIKIGRRMYFSGWQIVKAGQKTRQYLPSAIIPPIPWKSWALISRDIKLFRRDPVQWSQFAIFFGLLGMYIFNLRSMQYDIESMFWKNMISYLNMGSIALTLGTLCTRFIYPQMSLEARRMWIIGLMPIDIGKVLLLKYILGICLCSIITVGLTISSNIMLKVPADMAWLSIWTMLVMGLSLPGLALGLGAVFPNIKEDDMAHIVAGFGGTLTLVLSLLYIVCILIIAIFLKWLVLIIGISVITTALPLFLGYKSLLRLEV